jgi:hypothetical protein
MCHPPEIDARSSVRHAPVPVNGAHVTAEPSRA